jgi:1,4-alpha-glucan branching enzyme
MTSVGKDGSVEFRFFRPGARAVELAGDFAGNWSQRLAMSGDAHGWWTLELPLPPGDYRFRYVADGGEWYTDFASNGVEVNKLGWNSVLVVPEASGKPAAAVGDVEVRNNKAATAGTSPAKKRGGALQAV